MSTDAASTATPDIIRFPPAAARRRSTRPAVERLKRRRSTSSSASGSASRASRRSRSSAATAPTSTATASSASRPTWSSARWPRRRARSCSAGASRASTSRSTARGRTSRTEGVGTLRPRPGDRRGALLAQGRRRAHGAHRRRPAGDLVLLAAGERPGPRPDGAAARVPRRAERHAQARARRHDGAPASWRERIVEMATVVAGSEAARRRRPPICGNICTISPLSQDDDGHRGGARLRRGRHPRELHAHADHGLDGAGCRWPGPSSSARPRS